MSQNFGAQRRPSDVEQILSEALLVTSVVDGCILQSVQSSAARDPVTLHNGLRMNLHGRHELLGFPQQLRCEDTDRCRSISYFIVLDFGDVDQDLGGGIVESDGFQDGSSVVGDSYQAGGSGF
jgi:hypothetical protein